MVVWQSDYFLEPCLKSISPYGQIVVTEGPVSFWTKRGMGTSTDKTNGILRKLVGNKSVIHGVWSEKDEMMRAAEHLIPADTDFVWMVDSDEIYKAEMVERVIAALDTGMYDSIEFTPFSFFGGFSRYMTGFEEHPPFGWHRIQRWYPGATWETHRPPTVVAPDGKPWREHRHVGAIQSESLFGRYFHYSYVFPSQIKAKTEYYANKRTIPDYFNQVYRPWVLGERKTIEDQFEGVHDWLPEIRGACRTRKFIGSHPEEIQRVLPQLRERFAKEIAEL